MNSGNNINYLNEDLNEKKKKTLRAIEFYTETYWNMSDFGDEKLNKLQSKKKNPDASDS